MFARALLAAGTAWLAACTTPALRAPAERPPEVCLPGGLVGGHDTDRAGSSKGPGLEQARAFTARSRETRFGKYADDRFVREGTAISECFEKLGFRYSDGDRCSVEHLRTRLDAFGAGTAVVMDSGGAHGIAMAAELAGAKSYALVWKMGARFDVHGSDRTEQDLASFRYQFPALAGAGVDGPPVFVMDAHRGDRPVSEDEVDNTAVYALADYPSCDELKAAGIRAIVWITEGAKTDTAPVTLDEAAFKQGIWAKWEEYGNHPGDWLRDCGRAGIAISRWRISPYDCPYSRRQPTS